MSETDLLPESWRALGILSKDGPAFQEERRPLVSIRPLIDAGYAAVVDRTRGMRDIIEEIRITDVGRLALSKARSQPIPEGGEK